MQFLVSRSYKYCSLWGRSAQREHLFQADTRQTDKLCIYFFVRTVPGSEIHELVLRHHSCCVCPNILLKSYAGGFNLSMWFLVNDRAMIRPRWLCNRRQQGTFHNGWWKTRDTQLKIRTVPSGDLTSGHPGILVHSANR